MTLPASLEFHSAAGRWAVLATVLGSGIASLDATVVNVALPAIGRDFHAGMATLQWTVSAYALSLASLLLLGGALGDRYGRRRVFLVGVVWFAAASLLCGLAPTATALVAARALQGVGGALLTPGSLAILQASFRPEDRAQAIGAWSGLGGVATAVGPFAGGWLIQAVSWRLIFFINLPVAVAVVWVARRHVPETRAPARDGGGDGIDVAGAVLAALALGGLTWGLIEGPSRGWSSPAVAAALAIGTGSLALFLVVERRSAHPMLPLGLFRGQFASANLVTLAVYAALGGSFFLLPLALQQVAGYSPLAAGMALLPVTALLLLLSARAGRWAQRVGPRRPMTLGPLVAALGLALLTRVAVPGSYVTRVLPGAVVLGLAMTVAPLTATVLAAAPAAQAGIASAVNNDVARAAALLAVAVLPVAAGITGTSYLHPAALAAGFRVGIALAAGLCATGGLLALATIRNPPTVARDA